MFNPDKLYFFKYDDPVTKNRIDKWDRRPLVIPLHVDKSILFGLNLHWIPKSAIPGFIDFVNLFRNENGGRTNSKLVKLTYDLIKRSSVLSKFALKAVRKYRIDRISSINEIDMNPLEIDDLVQFKSFKKVNNR